NNIDILSTHGDAHPPGYRPGRRSVSRPLRQDTALHPAAPAPRRALRLRSHGRPRRGSIPPVLSLEGAQGRGTGDGPPRGPMDVLHPEPRRAGRGGRGGRDGGLVALGLGAPGWVLL